MASGLGRFVGKGSCDSQEAAAALLHPHDIKAQGVQLYEDFPHSLGTTARASVHRSGVHASHLGLVSKRPGRVAFNHSAHVYLCAKTVYFDIITERM